MKKTTYLLLFVLFLAGCDAQMGLNHVQNVLPGADIKTIPGTHYKFIARTTNGEIYYVESNGMGATITNLMFRAEK